jgi:predicted  nucleic acid-binding Zn-ribbon protein
MRFEAMNVRSAASDKLLNEAREHLLARAEEIRDYDRRMTERITACENLEARMADLENDRIQRESQLKELDQAKTTLLERSGALTRAYTAKDAALTRAEESIAALNARIVAIEAESSASKQHAEQQIEELNAALRREQLERSVVEGALETGRKDFARLMREVMALQRDQSSRESGPQPLAANAA